MTKKIGPPSLMDTFSEAARTTVEFWALQWSRAYLLRTPHHGRGQTVLVIPGLGGGDLTTKLLRDLLNDKGFNAVGWGGGVNTGPNAHALNHLGETLDRLYRENGNRKIALVGHSLGGIFARELARCFPDKVSQVITLGSPFGAGNHPDSSMPLLRTVFNAVNTRNNPLMNEQLAQQALTPPPVPTTALYTRHDGVVNWRVCINPDLPRTENVEIRASHCGLILNPAAMLVVLDRLSQNLDKKPWEKFESLNYHPLLLPIPQAHYGNMPDAPVIKGQKTLRLFK